MTTVVRVFVLTLALPLCSGVARGVELFGPDDTDPEITLVDGIVTAIFGFRSSESSRNFRRLCIEVMLTTKAVDILGEPEVKIETFVVGKDDIMNRFPKGWQTSVDFAQLSLVTPRDNATVDDYALTIREAVPCPEAGSSVAMSLLGILALASARRLVAARRCS